MCGGFSLLSPEIVTNDGQWNSQAPLDNSIAAIVKRKLDQARDQLIDRNLRNKLVNCPLTSKRSKQIRVVDELPDEVFRGLLSQKREFTFAAGRGVEAEGSESEIEYGDWTPPIDDEVDASGVARRHRDNVLQTQLTEEGLQKRLTSLYYESREAEEEQGVNVLYLALGFLRWFEDGRSEVERFAPLLLLPVELTRQGARERFRLKIRDEDLFTNVSLKVWLAEQHSIQLPELPESDDWSPNSYFAQVRDAVADADRWKVLDSEILLGFFSFSKFLLWRDLDPKNWPTVNGLLGHGVLRTLLAPQEENPTPDPPVIPDDSRVDDLFKAADLSYVLDADSSQTAAIQTALAGRNLVIQGPPGTGKSQTIANVIAAAIRKGKSVLFVAEKMAALEVVYERLKAVGLGPLCLELHSRKASKQQVVAQLREALEAPVPPRSSGDLCQKVDACVSSLWAHSDRLHKVHEPSGQSPYQVIGQICRLRDHGVALPDFRVVGAEDFTKARSAELLAELTELTERLVIAGVPARHPWRDCGRSAMSPLDVERLNIVAARLAASVQGLGVVLRPVWPLVRGDDGTDYHETQLCSLAKVIKALQLAASRPAESVAVLCNPRWGADLEVLERIKGVAVRLAEIREALAGIFTSAAWTRDWANDRAEIAGSGRSILRVFRAPYRGAIRSYRGACKAGLPRGFDNRISMLDRLIEGQELARKLAQEVEPVGDDLGSIARDLPDGWPRLARLVDWVRDTVELEPLLRVRNPDLLEWSESPDGWAEKLEAISKRAHENLQELATSVQFEDPSLVGELPALRGTVGELSLRALAWKESTDRYNEWPPVRDGMKQLATVTNGSLHQRVYDGIVQAAELVNRVRLAMLEQAWNRMIVVDPQLATIDGRILDRKVAEFRQFDVRRISESAQEVARTHYDQKPTGNVGVMGIIRGEINKARRHLPVRKLMEQAGHAVQQLKPLFLMSPLSIAQYLPPGRIQFDLLLIDEASQVRPEDALGAVARAKQVVVVGDAKQLPPTNFFNRLVADGDQEADELIDQGSPAIASMESILNLCDATFTSRAMLEWHYRSQHPALIAVSNKSFYDNRLLLPPSVVKGQAAEGLGVVFRKSPARGYDRGRSASNVVEADIVAEAVCEFARRSPDKSLGVGTFSVAQRDVIRDRVDAKRRSDPSLEPFFSTSRPHPFFVKNLESIQGDERDVIFISVGYGRDSDGRLLQNFGPINNDGGERRLNVLISRARERCEVFSSITSDDIDVSSRKLGVVAFKEFLQYADKGYFDIPTPTARPFDSDFEESVAEFLRGRGYRIDPQVGMSGFFIDLGVVDSANESRYLLGIECDGATYHSSRSARDRDRIRQAILESRGWTIHRIWSTDWFHRRAGEERRLLDVLTGLESGRRGSCDPIPALVVPPPIDPQVQEVERPIPVPDTEVPSTPAYVVANFKVRSDQAPHQASLEKVSDAIYRIVTVEGPVHEEEVARRLATVWGLDRAGSRIQEAAHRALLSLRRNSRLTNEGKFWSSPEGTILSVRNRSQLDVQSLRLAKYLPPAEIIVCAMEILRDNVRVPVDELVVEVARRLGFLRTGQDLQDVIAKAVSTKIGVGIVRHGDGSLSVE